MTYKDTVGSQYGNHFLYHLINIGENQISTGVVDLFLKQSQQVKISAFEMRCKSVKLVVIMTKTQTYGM